MASSQSKSDCIYVTDSIRLMKSATIKFRLNLNQSNANNNNYKAHHFGIRHNSQGPKCSEEADQTPNFYKIYECARIHFGLYIR